MLTGLERLTAGRTVIVVAHRLSTLRRADRIHAIEQGRVVERGTHAEPATRPGVFRDMNLLLDDQAAPRPSPRPRLVVAG